MAIDKLNFSGINSGSESLVTPIGSLSERLMKYGSVLNQNALDEAKQKRLDEQDAYQKQRDAIADRRQEKIDKRSDLETASQDLYKNELFKGQQTKGGSYGEALSSEASKYDLTPDEQTNMQKYFANGSYDTNAMRKSGNNILADKVDWQTKVSNNVENFIASGVGKESRPEMYDRIGSMLVSKGYTPPESLVTSADQARLTEAKAEEEKLKDIETQRSEILKRNREDNWKVVNAKTNSGGETTYDADGNELYVGKRTANSLQKEFKTGADNNKKQIKIIQESINKLDKIDREKKSDAINQVNSVINAVAARGIPIDEAARIVSNELTQKGDQSFFFEKFAPDVNQKSIDAYADQFVKNMPKKQNISYGSSNDGASKFDLALELAAQNKTSDSEALAKLNSDKAKLLAGEETRRANRIDEWLKSQGILGKSSSEQGIVEANGITGKPLEARINKNIKTIDGIPDSLVASEGVTNASYKDGKGYSVAMGYNLHANKDEIEKDFSYAGISKDKAFIAKTRPQDLVLSDEEAQRLSQVAFYKYADNLDKKLGGNFDKLSPQMQTTALQMHYRGDLFNDADYAKQLQKYVAKDDFDGLVKYVSDNSDSLPKPLVRRLENDLGSPTLENLRGTMTSTDKDNYLLSKSNQVKTPSGSDNKVVDIDSSPTSDISDKYIKSIFEKEKEASKDDFFGDGSTRANTNLRQSGVSQKDIDRVRQEKKDKEKSDNLIADRNYRVALRNNGTYDGKTAEEWNDLRSTTNKIGDYAWTAPVAAALAPATMAAASIPVIANTVNGAINSIKSIGEAKRMQQMLDEAITTTSKAKQSAEDLQKIEQLKEAHKYLLQMMRRGMYY